ncbi:MAG: MFS transporter [Chloroflexi bacterium]|nr:MFS transporter [Chloroflexota bacterium]
MKSPIEKTLLTTRVLYFLYFAAFGIFITYIDIYFRSLGFSGVQIGWINSILALVAIFAGPIWGFLSDRHGSIRPYLAIAALGTAALAFGISQTNSFVIILVVITFFGFFRQPLLPLLDSLTIKSLKQRPELYGRQRVWGSVGFILTAWGFGLLLSRVGLIWLFAGFIGAMMLMAIGIYWLPATRTSLQQPVWSSLGGILKNWTWWLFILSITVLGIGNVAMQHFLGIYIQELGGNEALIGTVAALATLAELPILFWGAPLIARFGPWRLLLFAYIISALRWFAYGIMPSAEWAIPIALLNSVTFGVYWVAGVAYVNQLAPKELKATAQGLFYASFGISGVLGSPINGYIFDTLGASWLFLISSVLGLGAAGLLWLGRPATALTTVNKEVSYANYKK